MASEIETSVAQVGLRDLLFYVIPGAVILIGILALEGVSAADLKPYLGVSSSIAGILVSYTLGQCAYPLAYVIRGLMNKLGRLAPLDGEEDLGFTQRYRWVAKKNPTYFAVEVFRYRTMARFCSLMVGPILFTAMAMVGGGWHLTPRERALIGVFALLASSGFLQRYYRYEYRYRLCLQQRKDRQHEQGIAASNAA